MDRDSCHLYDNYNCEVAIRFYLENLCTRAKVINGLNHSQFLYLFGNRLCFMTVSCKINIDIAQRDGFHKKKTLTVSPVLFAGHCSVSSSHPTL
jgi:hypothetical protein